MSKPTTTITAHKHTDRRANIPTEELRDFVADELACTWLRVSVRVILLDTRPA